MPRRRGSSSSVASRRSGRRASSSSNRIRSSKRASGAPRQWWRPNAPNDMWSLGDPGHVEPVRVLEHGLVAVGRRVQQEDAVALPDLLAVDLHVLRRRAVHVADGTHPAQHLLDRAGHQLGLGPQPREHRTLEAAAAPRIAESLRIIEQAAEQYQRVIGKPIANEQANRLVAGHSTGEGEPNDQSLDAALGPIADVTLGNRVQHLNNERTQRACVRIDTHLPTANTEARATSLPSSIRCEPRNVSRTLSIVRAPVRYSPADEDRD